MCYKCLIVAFWENLKHFDVLYVSSFLSNFADKILLFQSSTFEICNVVAWELKMLWHYSILALSTDIELVTINSLAQSLACLSCIKSILADDGMYHIRENHAKGPLVLCIYEHATHYLKNCHGFVWVVAY